MRDRLFDILTSIKTPYDIGGEYVGDFPIVPKWVAEKITDVLIENGVIVPTFKVGDIVWVYDFMWGVIPCEVDRPYHIHTGKEGGCTFEVDFDESDIGTYVFATKEEAEKYWHEGD